MNVLNERRCHAGPDDYAHDFSAVNRKNNECFVRGRRSLLTLMTQ